MAGGIPPLAIFLFCDSYFIKWNENSSIFSCNCCFYAKIKVRYGLETIE
jgi:hypothetical protein